MDKDWSGHNSIARNKLTAPSTALSKILASEPPFKGLAIDLGCGSGADSIALLNSGWSVLAVDHDHQILDDLSARYPHEIIETSCQNFEQLIIPSSNWINASFSLPFCKPDNFDIMWQTIQNSLQTGGYFSGHFFGPKDSWSHRPDMTFQDQQQVSELFKGFDIIWEEEIERDGKTLGGGLKHWHVFHIAAQKH